MRSRNPRFLSELQQKLQRLISDPVLGIVEIDAGRFDGQSLAASMIVPKKLPQMGAFQFLMVLLE